MRWGIFLSRLNRDTHWKGGGGKVPARGKPLGRRLAAGNGTTESGWRAWNARVKDEGGRDGIAGT